MASAPFKWHPVWLTPAEQRLYGIDRMDLRKGERLLSRMAVGARPVLPHELWLEAPIDTDWVAAYRLAFEDDDTRVVVAEIRIFPSADPRAANTGRWIADVLGSDAPVPRGGLKARTVRKLTLHAFRNDLKRLFARMALPVTIGSDEPTAGSKPGGTRGRKPTPDRHYATAAVLYESFYLNGSSRPTADVARAMALKPATARGVIAQARARQLLTRTDRGARGGRATARARQLDAGGAHALQRIATEVGTGGTKAPQARTGRTKNARHSSRGNSGR